MTLVFDTFGVRTSVGEILFTDLLTLLGTEEFEQSSEWVAEFLQRVGNTEGFFECKSISRELDELHRRTVRKFREEVDRGERPTFPGEEELRLFSREDKAVIVEYHRQDFRNHSFRLTVDGEFYGVWVQSSNAIESRDGDTFYMKTFPGPCLKTLGVDDDSWHRVTAEIILAMSMGLEFFTSRERDRTFIFSRIEFPDRKPLPGAFILADALEAGGLSVVTYPPQEPREVRIKSAEAPVRPTRRRRVVLRDHKDDH